MAFVESQLRGEPPIWLLEVPIGGHPYRFASRAVTVIDGATPIEFLGTLSNVDYGSAFTFASADFDLPAASVEVTFKDDIARRIEQGADLAAATATLALWIAGTQYADRRVVISGAVSIPSYGALGEPVSFDIESDFLKQGRQIPAADHLCALSSFPDLDPNTEGRSYPIIIGAPAFTAGGAGSPAYIVDGASHSGDKRALIAGHIVAALTVDIVDSVGNVYAGKAVFSDLDGNGNIYSYVIVTNAQYDATRSYFARWINGGGLVNPYGPGALTGGGDLVRWLLRESGATISDGKAAAVASALNPYIFDGYIGERVDALQLLQDEILPLLPASLIAGDGGIYPIVWRYDATEARAQLTADLDIYRAGLVEYEQSKIENEITLTYKYNCRYDELRRRTTVTGAPAKTSDLLWRNQYTSASYTRYGTRAANYESGFIERNATAGRVLNWLSRAKAGALRSIVYQAPTAYAWLDVGDVVSVSDHELAFDNKLMIIRRIDWGEIDLSFDLLVIPDLPRESMIL